MRYFCCKVCEKNENNTKTSNKIFTSCPKWTQVHTSSVTFAFSSLTKATNSAKKNFSGNFCRRTPLQKSVVFFWKMQHFNFLVKVHLKTSKGVPKWISYFSEVFVKAQSWKFQQHVLHSFVVAAFHRTLLSTTTQCKKKDKR